MYTVFHTAETYLYIKHNGKMRHIKTQIAYAWDYEQDSVQGSYDFGDKKANDEYLERFKNGELLNVTIKVTANALGEHGSDYLGGCHVKASTLESDMLQTAIQHDMKNQACIELKANILSAYKTLNDALTGKVA